MARLATLCLAVLLLGTACQPTMSTEAFFAEADQRIAEIRQRDLVLQLVDPAGKPVADAAVELRQTRHAFGFGSAIRPWDEPFLNPQFQAMFKQLFEWGIDEGALNWISSEPEPGKEDYYVADRLVEWAQANGIKLHGPPLLWANDLAEWQKPLEGDALKQAMIRRLDAVTRYRGKLEFWDVENELMHYDFFVERLGPEIRPWMFKEVKKRDPDVKLMVNDYEIIAGADPDNVERYKALIRDLQAQGAAIDAVGVQGHFIEEKWIDPVEVYRRLDSLAELGLPIWITEYDYGTWDVALRANALEAVYRAAFSHPMVDGIIMWGFYEKAQWRPQYLPDYGPAHIVDADWRLNEAGRRYVALRDAWTTKASSQSDARGAVRLRGFHGDYAVTVTPQGGAAQSFSIELPKGKEPKTVTLTVQP